MNIDPAQSHRPSVPGSASPERGGEDGARQAPMPSDQLLRGRRIVEIAHNGEVYRLQSTRLGKLILTK
jgi:hypothetical protein